MARSGLRMMPTFPLPSLKFRTAGFPQYGFKAGMSDKAFPGNAALASLSLPSSFVLPASLVGSRFCAGGRCALVWIGDLAEIKTKRVKKRKNDRNDARLLRRLMLENNFPQIWVPSPENRDLRQLLWHRHRLVQMRTEFMNQLQALASPWGRAAEPLKQTSKPSSASSRSNQREYPVPLCCRSR